MVINLAERLINTSNVKREVGKDGRFGAMATYLDLRHGRIKTFSFHCQFVYLSSFFLYRLDHFLMLS